MRGRKKADKTGETRVMKTGLTATIVEYRSYDHITVEFENGLRQDRSYTHFKQGSIKSPQEIHLVDDYVKVYDPNLRFYYLIDKEDIHVVDELKWGIDKVNGYIRGWRNGGFVPLHRYIMKAPDGVEVDHKNGIKNDCRRSNLRLCTRSENNMNKAAQINNTSGYKGVKWNKREKKWRAVIGVRGKTIHIGCFETAQEAAAAYNEASIKHHGEFARLNEI